MLLSIDVELSYRCLSPCNILLQVETAKTDHQQILKERIQVVPDQPLERNVAGDGIGERIWVQVENRFQCTYQARVQLSRPALPLSELAPSQLKNIGSDAIKYLMSSRYCHLERFEAFATEQFKGLSGGELVIAACDWIKQEFTYNAGTSNALTTAYDAFVSRQGVCRDYAHVLISILRASTIPARMVSAYSPGATPPDFHAVVEAYLDGSWYLVDPTGMATADELAIIGVGRDAADISFLTSYGPLELLHQSVRVMKINNIKQ